MYSERASVELYLYLDIVFFACAFFLKVDISNIKITSEVPHVDNMPYVFKC